MRNQIILIIHGGSDYKEDFRDKSRAKQAGRKSSIDLEFADVACYYTGSVSGSY